MVERLQRGRREHAGLPHRAAHHLLVAPRLLDQLATPASTAPTGAPRPLVKSIQAVSKPRACSAADTPLATTAFIRRAPSRWALRPWRRGDPEHLADRLARPHPPAADVRGLLHRHEPRARPVTVAAGRIAASTCAGLKMPPAPSSVCTIAPESAAGPPASYCTGWACGRGSPRRRRAGRAAGSRSRCTSSRTAGTGRPPCRAVRRRAPGAVDGRIVEALLVADLGLRHRAPHLGRGRVCVSLKRLTVIRPRSAFRSSASRTTASRPSSRTRSGNRSSTRSRAAPRARRRARAPARPASCHRLAARLGCPRRPPPRAALLPRRHRDAAGQHRFRDRHPESLVERGLYVHGGPASLSFELLLRDPAGQSHVRLRAGLSFSAASSSSARRARTDVGEQRRRPHERPSPLRSRLRSSTAPTVSASRSRCSLGRAPNGSGTPW